MNYGHLLAVMFLNVSGSAQDGGVDRTLIDGVAACLDIRDDTQRLACSDAAARKLVDAVRRKDVVIVDREAVKSTRRSLFGFPLPSVGLFGRDGPDRPEDQITQLDAKIERVADLGYGKYTITVEGGARWTTTEAWTGTALPAPGATLSIRRGALGGYMVRLANGRSVRAIRVG
ncbi:MAG TPA: hypothetical protein VFO80_01080 [Sphingomonas sp.]|nr:hypothetical protein [Sphingomonas sp.]